MRDQAGATLGATPLHPQPRLRVADSFRVRRDPASGRAQVRGWLLHLARFRASVAEVTGIGTEVHRAQWALDSAALDAFLHDAARRIATEGAGFPRLELWETTTGLTLQCALRPLPTLGTELAVYTTHATHTDPSEPREPRDPPHRKGPHIERYRDLAAHTGGETLLLAEDGTVLEGTTTSIVWWAGDTLHVVGDPAQPGDATPASPRDRVPSVTEQLLLGVTSAPVRRARLQPSQLTAHEVWAVNALHGIRPIMSIDGHAVPAPQATRLAQYRALLDGAWSDVDGLNGR